MRKRIIFYLKNSNFFSQVYFWLGTFGINLLKLVTRPEPKTALFVSYGGKQCSDSPYAVYTKMKNDRRFADWKLIWAFVDPDAFDQVANKVRIDSLAYFKVCLQARVWVTNSGIKRYLSFRAKKNIFINTWHGIPLKKIGIDEVGVHKSKVFARKWFEFKQADINLCHADYDFEILKHVFNASADSFYHFGLPRNDLLYAKKEDTEFQNKIREKLNIPVGKKVILYAPTVRGEQVTNEKDNMFINPFNFELWQKKFPEVVILFRAHYFVTKQVNTDYSNVIDVTSYPDIDELYLIADMLISDYSSVFFDYSILDRPMFCYGYDLDRYEKYQGLYMDPRKVLPHFAANEAELLDQIQKVGFQNKDLKTTKFREKYLGKSSGHASEAVINEIITRIES